MNESQARLILRGYRPEEQDKTDPFFAEALETAQQNPELARWFAEEREFDRAIAAHLEAVAVPFGLKTRILANAAPATSSKSTWAAGLVAVAALLFLLAQMVNFWRASAPASPSLPDYEREMVSFIQLAPPLEMESSDLGQLQGWLAQKEIAKVAVPPRLAALDPVGCRILSFRGRAVTLICFHRGEGKRLAHLFAVDRAALPKLKRGSAPVFAQEGEWMTASWVEKDRAYMVVVQGDRAAVQRYLPDA